MALPQAVRRNAEKARRQVAESNGSIQPEQSPQVGDDEYLAVNADIPSSHVQTARIETSTPPQQDVDTGFRPHALSENASPELPGTRQSSGEQVANLSHADPGTTTNSDFIAEDDFKGRFIALRATRDERSQRLQSQVDQLQAENERLRAQVPKADDAAVRFELDDETRANLGEDRAKEFDQFNETVEQRLAQQNEQQKQIEQRDIERFETDLESMVPRWRTINADPKWLQWCVQHDSTGARRQDRIEYFVKNRDAKSVAAIFREFVSGNAEGQQRNGESPSPEFDAQRANSGLGAEEQLVEVWSQSEISDFYHRKNRLYQAGKLRGSTLEQVMAEEAKIRKAMEEGRVDNNA